MQAPCGRPSCHGKAPSVAVVIPIRNAARHAEHQIAALLRQSPPPCKIVVIDSESDDRSPKLFAAAGFHVHRIARTSFDHGATRNLGAVLTEPSEVVAFLTQDAIPEEADALRRLVRPFSDPLVAVTFGRQLPRAEAGPIERHARMFNYPPVSREMSLVSESGRGVKAFFNSNAFAAYRRSAMDALGWFPERVILSEDHIAAGRAMLAGWKIVYASDAEVTHSHGYSVLAEFRRYFDQGVFHAQHRYLLDAFGNAESEGWRYVRSELTFLLCRAPHRIPEAMLRSAAKLSGYRIGRKEALLPTGVKRRLAMHPHFFDVRAEKGEHEPG